MTVERTSTRGSTACGCAGVQVTTTGVVNVYACGGAGDEPGRPDHRCRCSTDPVAPGQCVPLAVGAKPKQSQRTKLDTLLAASPVPSALAAAFVQTSRRYQAGRSPANALEHEAFGVLAALPEQLQATLACALRSFDALPAVERDQLVDTTLLEDLDTPVDAARLGTAVAREVTARVGDSVFGDPQAATQERPGRSAGTSRWGG
jgi:hypothetical protein